jgi:hypothetical protein
MAFLKPRFLSLTARRNLILGLTGIVATTALTIATAAATIIIAVNSNSNSMIVGDPFRTKVLRHPLDAPSAKFEDLIHHFLRLAGQFEVFGHCNIIDRTAQPVQEIVQSGFGVARPQARGRCQGLEIRAAEIIVFAIELEREAVVLKLRKDVGRDGVVKRCHPDTAKLPFAGLGDLKQSHIFEMHIAVGD